MKGFDGFCQDRLGRDSQEAQEALATLRHQMTRRIEGIKQRIRSFGPKGDFALANTPKVASDIDFGEFTSGLMADMCLLGPVAMMFSTGGMEHAFGGVDDLGGFSVAGLVEGICFLVDTEQDNRTSSFHRHKGGHYPEGRRQTKWWVAQNLLGQFNNVSNRNINACTEVQLKSELQYLQALLKIVRDLEKDNGRKEFPEKMAAFLPARHNRQACLV